MSKPKKKKMDLITKMMITGGVGLLIGLAGVPISLHYLSKSLEKAAPELKKSAGDGITFISSAWNAGQQPAGE